MKTLFITSACVFSCLATPSFSQPKAGLDIILSNNIVVDNILDNLSILDIKRLSSAISCDESFSNAHKIIIEKLHRLHKLKIIPEEDWFNTPGFQYYLINKGKWKVHNINEGTTEHYMPDNNHIHHNQIPIIFSYRGDDIKKVYSPKWDYFGEFDDGYVFHIHVEYLPSSNAEFLRSIREDIYSGEVEGSITVGKDWDSLIDNLNPSQLDVLLSDLSANGEVKSILWKIRHCPRKFQHLLSEFLKNRGFHFW